MSVPLNNNTSYSLIPSNLNFSNPINLSLAQTQTQHIAQTLLAPPFPKQGFSCQPNTILSNFVLAYLKLPELARIALVDKRVNKLCINLLVAWINSGNPIIYMNRDVENLIPFFRKKRS